MQWLRIQATCLQTHWGNVAELYTDVVIPVALISKLLNNLSWYERCSTRNFDHVDALATSST